MRPEPTMIGLDWRSRLSIPWWKTAPVVGPGTERVGREQASHEGAPGIHEMPTKPGKGFKALVEELKEMKPGPTRQRMAAEADASMAQALSELKEEILILQQAIDSDDPHFVAPKKDKDEAQRQMAQIVEFRRQVEELTQDE